MNLNSKPDDIYNEKKDMSIFIWIDILGFSALSEEIYDTSLLEDIQNQFNCKNIDNISEHIISDGLLFEIRCETKTRFLDILETIKKLQFKWVVRNKRVLRGGISIGRKIKDNDSGNSICATNGLSRAHYIEVTHVNWPIIGTSERYLKELEIFFCDDPTDLSLKKFGLKHTFNTKGDDVYFLDFLEWKMSDSEKDTYKMFLCDKMQENLDNDEKKSIQIKYIWLWKHFINLFPSEKENLINPYKKSIL